MPRNNIDEFIKGIFSLNTRRFGRIPELMIQKLYGFKDPDSNAYDLLTEDGKRVEVKFSTVLETCGSKITANNLIDQGIKSNIDNRALTYEMSQKLKYDCNIQQLKPAEFDILYYGCFFTDKIMICKMSSDQVSSDPKINYSGYQHRGNEGEGQFHINPLIFNYHLKTYFVRWISYEELYHMFDNKDRS